MEAAVTTADWLRKSSAVPTANVACGCGAYCSTANILLWKEWRMLSGTCKWETKEIARKGKNSSENQGKKEAHECGFITKQAQQRHVEKQFPAKGEIREKLGPYWEIIVGEQDRKALKE
nr:hypothetical protein Iba_chr12aCG24050 [Ipomoea batatas]